MSALLFMIWIALLGIAAGAFSIAEELVHVTAKLREANDLTRERWADDYKTGRIEKPVRVTRKEMVR